MLRGVTTNSGRQNKIRRMNCRAATSWRAMNREVPGAGRRRTCIGQLMALRVAATDEDVAGGTHRGDTMASSMNTMVLTQRVLGSQRLRYAGHMASHSERTITKALSIPTRVGNIEPWRFT